MVFDTTSNVQLLDWLCEFQRWKHCIYMRHSVTRTRFVGNSVSWDSGKRTCTYGPNAEKWNGSPTSNIKMVQYSGSALFLTPPHPKLWLISNSCQLCYVQLMASAAAFFLEIKHFSEIKLSSWRLQGSCGIHYSIGKLPRALRGENEVFDYQKSPVQLLWWQQFLELLTPIQWHKMGEISHVLFSKKTAKEHDFITYLLLTYKLNH